MGSADDSADELDASEAEDKDRPLLSRRRCAAKAVANISLFARQLRGSGAAAQSDGWY